MPDDTIISLNFVKPQQGEDLCAWFTNVETLLSRLTQHLIVPADKVNQSQVYERSALQPGVDDRDKIWIKTSQPYGLGFFAGGQWNVSPAIPAGLIYAQDARNDVPQGFREVSEDRQQNLGLPALSTARWIEST